MKKWLSILSMCLCLGLLAACMGINSGGSENDGVGKVEYENPEEEPEQEKVAQIPGEGIASGQEEVIKLCRVVSIDGDNLLLAEEGEDAAGVYRIGINGVNILSEEGSSLPESEIREGSMIEVVFSGYIEETFPGRLCDVTAVKIKAKEFDNLCSIYLTVLEELWEVDGALNSDITVAGMDLSATGLSYAEQSALAWRFGEIHGVWIIQGTFEELAEQGYINEEELYWEDGCLFSITEKGSEEADGQRTMTFDAGKWRSGLGAYYFMDCTSKQNSEGKWEAYQRGAEAIA